MKNLKWLKLPDNTRVEINYKTWKQILKRAKRKDENWCAFGKKIGISKYTLQNYFYQQNRPPVSALKKIVKNTDLDPKIIENGINWTKKLQLLSAPQLKFDSIVVQIDGELYIDLTSLIVGSKIHGISLTEQFPFQYQILSTNKIRVWYETGGGQFIPKLIHVKRFVPLNEETLICFGLLQAESCKVKGYLSLDFSNCLPFLQRYVLDYFEKYWGISRNLWKCEIFYWKGKLTQEIQKRLKLFWKKELRINSENIKIREGTRYRLSEKASRYGVASIKIHNKALRTLVMIVLDEVIKFITEKNYHFCGYYLQGLLAGDGTLSINTYGSLSYAGIAFNPNSNERNHYFKLLDLIGVKINKKIPKKKNRRLIQITGWWNYLKILQATENRPFFIDNKKNLKFYRGFLTGQYVKPLTRIKIFERVKKVTSKNYSNEFKVSERNAIDCLNRLVKLGFAKKNTENKLYIYTLTKNGENFLNRIKILERVVKNV